MFVRPVDSTGKPDTSHSRVAAVPGVRGSSRSLLEFGVRDYEWEVPRLQPFQPVMCASLSSALNVGGRVLGCKLST